MFGRDVLISWVRNIPWSFQKTKDFRREIIWDFSSSICTSRSGTFFAIFFQASRYCTGFQASSGKSDSANWLGYEAGAHIKVVPSLLESILICVSWNWFVFREIDLCFGKLICVLENQFVFWQTDLCFGKLICVLGNWFVFEPFWPQ